MYTRTCGARARLTVAYVVCVVRIKIYINTRAPARTERIYTRERARIAITRAPPVVTKQIYNMKRENDGTGDFRDDNVGIIICYVIRSYEVGARDIVVRIHIRRYYR